ncbi:hypothetical protein ABZ990_24200 [Streptomyces sp. NPDC046203]|uniref:hypothetical protein n=1 Tax=Streptomyces sp. NPDC046203 TaxID=3154602 RepID=UPI0033E86C65
MTDTTIEHHELGRFLAVAAQRFARGEGPAEMFSGAVDAEWHRLLSTSGYAEFSTTHAGAVLGHREMNGSGPVGWVSAYEKAYGPLPEVWFTDGHGTLDADAFARYRKTGTVVAEWDCGPVTEGDDEGEGDAVPDSR